ncbi:hypothetical protein [Sphingobium subterraneum]|uniref:Uncharacterized protein n=1 Tax=Sphingobium subterraneum TaxID=627688 RepID=A0A841J244_9SPHN|nr:hypothetical protein [Sphingobium subterraneum]MBB6124897.1 hypothetical protein [Sphingobium subterraneum]
MSFGFRSLSAAAYQTAKDRSNEPDSAYHEDKPDDAEAEQVIKATRCDACLQSRDDAGIATQGRTLFGFEILRRDRFGGSFCPSLSLLGGHGAGHIDDECVLCRFAFPWPCTAIWTAQFSGFGLFE